MPRPTREQAIAELNRRKVAAGRRPYVSPEAVVGGAIAGRPTAQPEGFPTPTEPSFAGFRPESVRMGAGRPSITFKREKPEKLPVSQQNELLAVRQQFNVVDMMEKLSRDIPGGRIAGTAAVMTAAITGGEWATSTAEYMDYLNAMSAGLYRNITGDKRLSDEDATTRARPLIWDPRQSDKLKERKFRRLKSMLKAREEMLAKGMFRTVQDPAKGTLYITPIADVKKYTEQEGLEKVSDNYLKLRDRYL